MLVLVFKDKMVEVEIYESDLAELKELLKVNIYAEKDKNYLIVDDHVIDILLEPRRFSRGACLETLKKEILAQLQTNRPSIKFTAKEKNDNLIAWIREKNNIDLLLVGISFTYERCCKIYERSKKNDSSSLRNARKGILDRNLSVFTNLRSEEYQNPNVRNKLIALLEMLTIFAMNLREYNSAKKLAEKMLSVCKDNPHAICDKIGALIYLAHIHLKEKQSDLANIYYIQAFRSYRNAIKEHPSMKETLVSQYESTLSQLKVDLLPQHKILLAKVPKFSTTEDKVETKPAASNSSRKRKAEVLDETTDPDKENKRNDGNLPAAKKFKAAVEPKFVLFRGNKNSPVKLPEIVFSQPKSQQHSNVM